MSKRREITLESAGLKPFVLRFANKSFHSAQLSMDRLITSARKTARCKDLGSDWWDEPLRVLVQSINEEARLSYIGSLIVRERLKGALVTRLRAQSLLKKHPEILDADVAPILLITGLQRTGTTYLQRLLSLTPQARALLSWETLDPVPHGNKDESAKRRRKARLSEKALAWMSPAFFAIHPIDHLRPEEDVLLLDPAFMSTAPEAIMHVPSYARWLEAQDHTYAYEWERKMLLLLQWQREADFWVLKSPHHLEHLDVIKRVFPNLNVIWMHRDPVECVPSFLSMVFHGRAMFSDHLNAAEVGRHWLRKNAHMVNCAMRTMEGMDDLLVHAYFRELVNDPLGLVQRLHKIMKPGLDTAAQFADVVREIKEHSRHRFGVHRYDADHFALTNEQIRDSFGEYLRRFGVHE